MLVTDMGGTTFKVGLVRDGRIEKNYSPVILRHAVLATKIWVESIGAGGGSIGWVDEEKGLLKVGPPDYFLGGRIRLDREAAQRAIREKVADPLGMGLTEAASGLYRITNAQMADLIRRATVERGHGRHRGDGRVPQHQDARAGLTAGAAPWESVRLIARRGDPRSPTAWPRWTVNKELPMAEPKLSVDPVTFEILSHRLYQITQEIGTTLERVGGTVNTTQMRDYLAGLYQPNGDRARGHHREPHLSRAGIPQHPAGRRRRPRVTGSRGVHLRRGPGRRAGCGRRRPRSWTCSPANTCSSAGTARAAGCCSSRKW